MGVLDSFPARFMPIASVGRLVTNHAESHIDDGIAWNSDYFENVDTGTAVSVLWTAPATGKVELVVTVEADKAITWIFSEAPSASGGTTLTSFNHNRQSANTDPMATVVSAITFTSSGTVLQQGSVGSGGGQGSGPTGGDGGLDDKWILATSQSYLMRVTVGASDTNVNINGHYDLSTD